MSEHTDTPATTPRVSRTIELVREIRERRLFRIFVSYLAAGWVILQVVSQLVSHGIVPNLAYELTLIWYLVGIPACLIIGWYHGERGDQKAAPLEIASLSALAVVAVFLSTFPISDYTAKGLRAAAAEGALDLRRLAVLYFDDLTTGGGQRHLADGFTEALIGELSEVGELDVISRNGVAQFRDADIPRDSIAQALDAGTLVDGTVEQLGDQLRVSVRLVDGGSGAEYRRAAFELPSGNPLAVRDSLVHQTSLLLREWLGDEIELRGSRSRAENPAAWALVQRARNAMKDAGALEHEGKFEGMEHAFQRADSLLAHAVVLDSAWAEPAVLRGMIDYRRSRTAHDPHAAVEWIAAGIEHANRALAIDPNDAEALELRGTLRYWHYLLHITPDPAEHDRLLHAARADLERAVQLDATLASAHSTLSHLYATVGDTPKIVLAARRAYEEDAYLDVIDGVLWRLFTGSYDLEDFVQAKRWCDEGARRFPDLPRFVECQLWVMTTPAAEADIARGWRLVARLDSVASQANAGSHSIVGRLLAGGVIARAGMPDSAQAVLQRAHDDLNLEVDQVQELPLIEAYMYTLAGDVDQTFALLQRYAAGHPDYSFEHHWWWEELRDHPRYPELASTH